MRAPTHLTFAGFLYLLLLTSAGVSLNALNGLVVLISSVLPDLDTGASTIGRLLPLISRRLERRFGHRTLTHSLPFTAALAIILIPLFLLDREVYCCFLAGYASHPLLDSCTMTGVRILYPVSNVRGVFPMDVNDPMRYRINTGSREETVLAVVFLLLSIPAFLIAHEGYERFVRLAQRNIESAVRDYNDFSRTHAVWVDCRACNLLTKERLAGRFRVVGSLDAQTLVILRGDGKLTTLGKEYRSDFMAEDAVCTKGDRAFTTVERIDMSGRTAEEISGAGEIHLFGTLRAADDLPADSRSGFATVSVTGRDLRLNFATPGELAARLAGVGIESGCLDVRHVVMGADKPVAPRSPAEVVESAKLQAEDELIFVVAPGETLSSGGLLVAWEEQGALRREVLEIAQSIVALRLTARKRLEDLALRGARLHATVQKDSAAFRAADLLCRKGFLPVTQRDGAVGELLRSLSAERSLRTENQAALAETDAKLVALRNRREACERRIVPGSGRREVRAHVRVLVTKIERREKTVNIRLRPL